MLDKIANIELNASGGKSKNKYRKPKFGEALSSRHMNLKDSLVINPAFRLLNHFGIILKELEKHTSGSLKILLQIEEFVFELKTDPKELIDNSSIEYDVSEDEKFNIASFRILLKTKTSFTDEFASIENVTLESLRFLFKRCKDLNISNEINNENTLAINNLLDKIYTKIIDEFTIVNSIVVRFHDLLNGTKILNKLMLERNFNELIIVKRIVPKHGNDN